MKARKNKTRSRLSDSSGRAGRYVQQPTGYRAFIPAALPPAPPIRMDDELARMLSDADRALGRLDGVATILPDPDLFVAMYVRQEAVLSSQIEGTQSTLEDVLAFEVEGNADARPKDVGEVVNYVAALNHGIGRLGDLPLSLRLIREIHGKLLEGVRGSERSPGEFRRSQNWIGPAGCSLTEAYFVPPPPHEMKNALSNFEKFLHDRDALPVLLHCAITHAQFETIHPFLDGNGRVGRLLVTFLLCERKVLLQPLLYLSYYFKAHRAQYYDRLMAVRNDGDWEGWLKFFVRGVYETSLSATETARGILAMREAHRRQIASDAASAILAQSLLDHLFRQPRFSIRMAEKWLGCTFPTATAVVTQLQDLGLVRETTGRRRGRQFLYEPYMSIFERLTLPQADKDAPVTVARKLTSTRTKG